MSYVGEVPDFIAKSLPWANPNGSAAVPFVISNEAHLFLSFRAKRTSFCHFERSAPFFVISSGVAPFVISSAVAPFVISSAAEKSGPRAISTIPTIAQVSPVGILQSNQPDFLLTTPSLDLLFSCYAGGYIAKCLKVNERIDLVATCEALDKTILVLTDSLSNIISEANVQSS